MNIFRQFWYSLYSPKTISKFRLQKIGKTILYLFVLAILYTLPGFFSFQKAVHVQVNNFTQLINDNIHSISLEKGNLTINDNKSFEKKVGNFHYAFYPSETTIPDKISNEKNAVYILRNKVVFKTINSEQVYPYPKLKSKEINKTDVTKFINNINQALPAFLVALFFLFYVGSCFFIFVVATILTIIAGLFGKGKNLPFRQRFAMVSYSLTLPTILFLLSGIFYLKIPFITTLFILLTALMYFLTLRALPSKKG